MNQLIKMDAETYANHWTDEAINFDRQNLYLDLAKISPKGRVLEIGCGNGLGTKQLSSDREILVIDNNKFLINKAKENNLNNPNITFIEADIFSLSLEQAMQIQDFSPAGIVAWLVGSDPYTVESRTPPSTNLSERPKLYREAVEDMLIIRPLCTSSVKWIHMAMRMGVDANATDEVIKAATAEDYEKYMLSNSDFKVSDVEIIDWNRNSEEFMYVSAVSHSFTASSIRNCVISVLVTR